MYSYLTVVVFLMLVSFTQPAIAQKDVGKEDNFFPEKIILLDTATRSTKAKLFFSDIHIIDARIDTTFSGIVVDPTTKDFFKTEFEHSVDKELDAYIRKNYSFEAGEGIPSLLVIVKRLWLTPSVPRHEGTKDRARADGISFCAELFINNNGKYHALYKIDSMYTGAYAAWSNGNLYVQEAIQAILARVVNQAVAGMHTGKTEFSEAIMQQYIRQSQTCKILEDAAWKNGVYKSFTEFKNNNPVITAYELKEARSADSIIYTRAGNGEAITISNYWGFCDGETVFIKMHDDIMPLYRYGNTFIVFGKGLKEKKGEALKVLGLGSMVLSHSKYRALTPPNMPAISKATRMPIMVDMETGITY